MADSSGKEVTKMESSFGQNQSTVSSVLESRPKQLEFKTTAILPAPRGLSQMSATTGPEMFPKEKLAGKKL